MLVYELNTKELEPNSEEARELLEDIIDSLNMELWELEK